MTLTFSTTGDGNSTAQAFESGLNVGLMLVKVRAYGTWDGATVKVQSAEIAGGTYVDEPGLEFTANAQLSAYLKTGSSLRINTASAGTTSVTVKVES
jgi:hypothetical protein